MVFRSEMRRPRITGSSISPYVVLTSASFSTPRLASLTNAIEWNIIFGGMEMNKIRTTAKLSKFNISGKYNKSARTHGCAVEENVPDGTIDCLRTIRMHCCRHDYAAG